MTEIARMRFMSNLKPSERGMLLLHDDGTLQVQPTEELRDEMARLEEVALDRARTFGTRLGVSLLVLGALATGAGWVVGRVFGKMGHTLSAPRPLDAVSLTHEEGGSVHLTLRGANFLQVVQMRWNPDEVLQGEAEDFVAKLDAMRRNPG